MNMTAVPFSAVGSIISGSTSACDSVSSAVVGSSAISTFGRSAMTLASMIRCRPPPENSCG
jgi:hypothetical protein